MRLRLPRVPRRFPEWARRARCDSAKISIGQKIDENRVRTPSIHQNAANSYLNARVRTASAALLSAPRRGHVPGVAVGCVAPRRARHAGDRAGGRAAAHHASPGAARARVQRGLHEHAAAANAPAAEPRGLRPHHGPVWRAPPAIFFAWRAHGPTRPRRATETTVRANIGLSGLDSSPQWAFLLLWLCESLSAASACL